MITITDAKSVNGEASFRVHGMRKDYRYQIHCERLQLSEVVFAIEDPEQSVFIPLENPGDGVVHIRVLVEVPEKHAMLLEVFDDDVRFVNV
jgi:hypothetical protein